MTADVESGGVDRSREAVYIDANHHDMYRRFTEATKEGLFPSMKEMFVFCAALGSANRTHRPMGKRVNVFKWVAFSEADEVPVLEAIAVAHTSDVGVLEDRNRILELAEEYATGGGDLLRQELTGSRDRNLETLGKLALQVAQSTLPQEP